VVARLAGLYGQALLLLQPPAPPPEPKKGMQVVVSNMCVCARRVCSK
jgi:hypothetical protein